MNSKKQKAFVLSVAMAVLMLSPITLDAQYREDRFGLQEWGQTGLLGKQGSGNRNGITIGVQITNDNFVNTAPLSSARRWHRHSAWRRPRLCGI